MRTQARTLAFVVLALVVAAVASWVGGRQAARDDGADTGGMALPGPVTPGTASFAAIAKAATPAVIHVKVESRRPDAHAVLPFFGGDLGDMFGRFFGGTPDPAPVRGVGSGVIIDEGGMALTNAHVVRGATSIEVVTPDGVERKATVVGADPVTDVAVLRIEDADDLPRLPLADSDTVQVGDWVVAVGSPFGLHATVTSGIVSAKARRIGAGPYDDFLQTDAAINPGNSGGPLVDMEGRVVGINTAIVQGGSGIGFAIPSNLARQVATALRESGKVTRGWLGVHLQPLTPDLAASFGLDEARGALVADVVPDSPAARAGLKPGDVVLEFNGKAVTDPATLARSVAFAKPGETARLTVRRGDGQETIQVTFDETPTR